MRTMERCYGQHHTLVGIDPISVENQMINVSWLVWSFSGCRCYRYIPSSLWEDLTSRISVLADFDVRHQMTELTRSNIRIGPEMFIGAGSRHQMILQQLLLLPVHIVWGRDFTALTDVYMTSVTCVAGNTSSSGTPCITSFVSFSERSFGWLFCSDFALSFFRFWVMIAILFPLR